LSFHITKLGTIATSVLALSTGLDAGADVLQLSNDTIIVVSADESWEELEENVRHFRGNFEIRTPDWAVSADQAVVYGRLDDPERVVADGSPVRFYFENSDSETNAPTEAEGRHLEYEKESGLLRLFGDAKIADDRRLMQSSEMQYDTVQKKLLAGGPEGVKVTVKPDDSGKL